MKSVAEKIKKYAAEAEAVWRMGSHIFADVIKQKQLRAGAEIGDALGGHSEVILKNTTIDRLYFVDPYLHFDGYDGPMNLHQEDFDQLYEFTLARLSPFGDRFQHIRKKSREAINDVPEVEFVYINAEHSYEGIWNDLRAWYSKVRIGGVIGGNGYNHPNFPGIKQAVDEFFKRFDWGINIEGEGVWWVEKQPLNVSFIMPAYNCEETVQESVESIMDGNFTLGDELVIVNDCSTDNTGSVLNGLKLKYPAIKVIDHVRHKGGAGARNTAAENARNQLIFCLDSDNVLASGSVPKLKIFMLNSGADVAAFQELHYFKEDTQDISHKWIFNLGRTTLSDCLSRYEVPGASGNYMFTKESWLHAGGYPEFSGALDTWGFGFRQLATGSKMIVMPDSYYYHRVGHESYWVRESRKGLMSLIALQIIIPYIDLIAFKDVDYIMSRKGRYNWFDALAKRPIRLKKDVAYEVDVGSDTKLVSKFNFIYKFNLLSTMKKFISMK